MKKKKKFFILFSFLFFLVNCHKEKRIKEETYSPLLTVNAESLDSLNLKDFVREIEFLLLETNSDALIDHIDKVKIGTDGVFILDKKEKTIFVFDHSGRFLSKIAKSGKGAGEYLRVDDFEIDYEEKNIYILDMIPKRILKYNLNGDFIDYHNLRFYADNFYKLENGYAFSLSGNTCNDDFCEKVIFTDDNFNISETFVPVEPNLENYQIEVPTSRLVKASEDVVRYIDINDMVYTFDGNTLSNIKRVNFMENDIDLSFYKQSFKNSGEFLSAVIKHDKAIWLHNYLENSAYIFFKYFLDSKTYMYIYSKKSDNGMVLRKKESKFISYAPLLIKDETFYEVKDITDILDKEQKSRSSLDSILYRKLKDEYPMISENSNPLIVKYSIEF